MKMLEKELACIVDWEAVRNSVAILRPELATVLDAFDPQKDYDFVKIRYPFGAKIFDYERQQFCLPNPDGQLVPIDDPTIPAAIQQRLDYKPVPIGLILKNATEVYFETNARVMPTKLFTAGSTFGLWEALDPPVPGSEMVKKVWNIIAGARTLFMLPKISDSNAHMRFRREFGITSYPPKSLMDHWKVFVELAQQMPAGRDWYCEVLFFSKKWLQESTYLPWLQLQRYWYQEAWKQSYNCRIHLTHDAAWEDFFQAISKRNFKPVPYIINTIKHLVAVTEGVFPGFIPAAQNDIAGPIQAIQQCYQDVYQLKQYAPIIMHPCHRVSGSDRSMVYYSLSLPTLFEYVHRPKNTPNIMTDLREIRMLMSVLQSLQPHTETQYSYFHTDKDQLGEVNNAMQLGEEDYRWARYTANNEPLVFPHTSPFLKGCIRIADIVKPPL